MGGLRRLTEGRAARSGKAQGNNSMSPRQHEEVLDDWQARYPDATFISDGPIDLDRWCAISRRVLFLAKEAYGDFGPGQSWDLPELVREEWQGPKHKFWWTLGYWAYGIHRLADGPMPPSPWTVGQKWEQDVTESLLSSAVVNIKKAHGRSRSSDDDLRQYVRQDGDLLKQQVQSLSPQVMVCCNTWHLVGDIWPNAGRVSEQVLRMDDMLVLDFWHPANYYPSVLCYYGVLALLQRALYPAAWR